MNGKIQNVFFALVVLMLAGCSGSASQSSADSAAAASIPSECERYFREAAKCTGDRPSTSEEADKIYRDMVQAYRDNGSGAVTPEQCSAAAGLLEGSC